MANTITLDGTAFKPEKRVTTTGKSVLTFALSFYNGKGADGGTSYGSIRVTVFGDLADNAEPVIHDRDKVIVSGHLKQDTWTDKSGVKQYRLGLIADDVAPAVSRFASKTSPNYVSGGNYPTDEEVPF